MRLFVSALLLAAVSACAQDLTVSVPASGQAGMEGPGLQASPLTPRSQAGCPLTLTSARLNWPGTYLPVAGSEAAKEPNLSLGLENPGGKAIRSVIVTARFLGKQSVYQLDAATFDVQLKFSLADEPGKTAEKLLDPGLPDKMHPYGLARVVLDQVIFADGGMWTATNSTNCRLDVQGKPESITR